MGKSVTHDSMPSQSGKIRLVTISTDTLNICIHRGENGPGGYKIIPIDEHHTQFVWLCDTDLKVCSCCCDNSILHPVAIGMATTVSY